MTPRAPRPCRSGSTWREIGSASQVRTLLEPYLNEARTDASADDVIAPFTEDAIGALLSRSDGKPRDILRKAHALIERAARENWEQIAAEQVREVIDSLALPDDDEEALSLPARPARTLEAGWAQGGDQF